MKFSVSLQILEISSKNSSHWSRNVVAMLKTLLLKYSSPRARKALRGENAVKNTGYNHHVMSYLAF